MVKETSCYLFRMLEKQCLCLEDFVMIYNYSCHLLMGTVFLSPGIYTRFIQCDETKVQKSSLALLRSTGYRLKQTQLRLQACVLFTLPSASTVRAVGLLSQNKACTRALALRSSHFWNEDLKHRFLHWINHLQKQAGKLPPTCKPPAEMDRGAQGWL